MTSQWWIQGGGGGSRCVSLGYSLIDCGFFFFLIPLCIRMLKNKAQIAREGIKNPESFRVLKWALDPTVNYYGHCARDVRAPS